MNTTVNNIAVPSPRRATNKYRVNVPAGLEAIEQPLYDYQTYAALGQTNLTFFATPMGQGGKTIDDTNMQLAGQLPAPQQFLCKSISLEFFPGVSPTPAVGATVSQFVNDVWAVGKSGTLTFSALSKNILQMAPLSNFPNKSRMNVSAALADTTTAAASRLSVINYAAWAGPTFEIAPIMILPNQNFQVTLTWAAAVPLPSAAAGRIGIKLNGILYRAVQ
jgi:hypothetical protein